MGFFGLSDIPVDLRGRVEEAWRDSDGYWAALKNGWFCDDGSCTCREDNIKSLIESIRDSQQERISFSECDECASCIGHGFFDDNDIPTHDRRCRKCLDCRGTGKQ